MKRIALFLSLLMTVAAAYAVTAESVINTAANRYQRLKSLSANYSLRSGSESTKGMIITSGDKFHITSGQMITWYDGRTQWSYSPSTNEVNISEPTPEELQQVNPFAIINAFRKAYKGTLLASPAGTYKIQLLPIDRRASIRKAVITLNAKTFYPSTILLTMDNNMTVNISVKNIKTGQNYPASTFIFNKRKYPRVTIVDLR